MTCIHPNCTHKQQYGHRGLCRSHYLDPVIRAMYPLLDGSRQAASEGPRCRHPGCHRYGNPRWRGLCKPHFKDPAVRSLYPGRGVGRPKEVAKVEDMESVELMIAEQMQNLPSWWKEDIQ